MKKAVFGLFLMLCFLCSLGMGAGIEDPRGIKVLYRESRTALVIGNAAYASSPLENPVNDAVAVAALLEKRNFDVTLLKNATQREIEAAIELFGRKLGSGGVGLFCYAGHGMQIGGHNYLIPVGASISSERDVKYKAVNIGKVLGVMEDAGNRLNLVFLDACRDNPFKRSFRTRTSGLAQMDAPRGTMIAYSTAPGKVAADGSDAANSIYTRYLLEQLGVPGQEIGIAMRHVRSKVISSTSRMQVPWESTSLVGNFYMTPIDMLDENLRLTKEQLARLQKLQREEAEAAAVMQKLESDKNAEMARYAKQIEVLRRRVGAGSAVGSSLDQIIELGEHRERAAAELAAAKQKAEQERRRREAKIAALKAEELANRKKEFEAANAKYEKVCKLVKKGYLRPEEHFSAWKTLCSEWGVKDCGKKPGTLGWNDMEGCVQIAMAGGFFRMGGGSGSGKTIDLGGGVKLELVGVEPGSFMMGSPSNESGRDDDEKQHRVTLSKGFWMGKYEVTQEQWQAVMGSNPSRFKGSRNPVEQVSWNACQEFIKKLNAKIGGEGRFRLPTEAEWEYAARGGNRSRGYKYAGGNDAGSVGWYRDNSGRKTHPVGQKAANELGLYDMSGNVWEWCQDWYGDYPSGSVTDPDGASSGSYRVYRGGCWLDSAGALRAAYRNRGRPTFTDLNLGFRLCLARNPMR